MTFCFHRAIAGKKPQKHILHKQQPRGENSLTIKLQELTSALQELLQQLSFK
jgi:hypothetical protein